MIIDMNRRGFTIVELLIVITIMGALLILGIANLRDSQISARDSERKTDIETIALHLENYYTFGSDTSSVGSYPSTDLVGHETTYLPDIDPNSFRAPGYDSGTSLIADVCSGVCEQTPANIIPQPTIDSQFQYVYQPLDKDGNLCTGSIECRKFNLFYQLEQPKTSTNCPAPGNICFLTSKNQ